ncbi:hypothetical protein RRF57_013119 [Xylaria bambusicola]|uniref:Uncharacterized protein n=1 Tax=Xylaria bambusicola TaxID=326684 RepID=A0AAN7UWC1_9PEZI
MSTDCPIANSSMYFFSATSASGSLTARRDTSGFQIMLRQGWRWRNKVFTLPPAACCTGAFPVYNDMRKPLTSIADVPSGSRSVQSTLRVEKPVFSTWVCIVHSLSDSSSWILRDGMSTRHSAMKTGTKARSVLRFPAVPPMMAAWKQASSVMGWTA